MATIEITVPRDAMGDSTELDMRAWCAFLIEYMEAAHDGADVRVLVGDALRTHVRAWADGDDDRGDSAESRELRDHVANQIDAAWESWLAQGAPGA